MSGVPGNTNGLPQLIIRTDEWVGGVRCMDCDTPLAEGMPYSERLSGFLEDTPLIEIVCVPGSLREAVGEGP